nr:M20/M25/M40 family metallo-hydrolase [Rhodothalassium salexigens]
MPAAAVDERCRAQRGALRAAGLVRVLSSIPWQPLARLLLLPALLLAAGLVAWVTDGPPRPLPADAPASAFSAARAMDHVRALAERPRPVGSPANAAARAMLIDRLRALGLDPQVQQRRSVRTVPWGGGLVFAADVANIVARLPGTPAPGAAGQDTAGQHTAGQGAAAPGADRPGAAETDGPTGGALLLMAHYDSRTHAPGAADDAAGVAAILETVRAVIAGGGVARDLIVLFTDGEEAGLLGARAFFEHHPWADQVGLVLNAEARGSRGTAVMFETSADNAALIRTYDRSVRPRQGNALTAAVYRRMPNDTDLSVALDHGLAGLNFAFIDGYFDYHAATDTPAHLDPASVQALGAQLLSATRAFGQGPLPPPPGTPQAGGSAVYFQIAGLFVHYPAAFAWPLTAVALAGVAGLVAWAWRAGRVRGADLVRAMTAQVRNGLVGAALLMALAALFSGGFDSVGLRRAMAAGDGLALGYTLALLAVMIGLGALDARGGGRPVRVALAVLVVAGLALGGVPWWAAAAVGALLAALGVPDRPVAARALWLGGLVWLGAWALAFQILLGPGSYVLVWPLLLATGAAAVTLRHSWPHDDWRCLALAALSAVPALLWAVSIGHFLFLALGVPVAAVLVVPAWLLALSATPLVVAAGRALGGALAWSAAGAAALTLAWVAMTAGFDARHPRPASLMLLVDRDTGSQHWVSRRADPGAWEANVLGARPTALDTSLLKLFGRSLTLYGRAVDEPIAGLAPGPVLDAAPGQGGATDLVLRPSGPGATLILSVASERPVRPVAVGGVALGADRALGLGEAGRLQFFYQGVPEDGLAVRLAHDAPLDVQAFELRHGWPPPVARRLPAQPADVMPAPSGFSHAVLRAVRRQVAPPPRGDDPADTADTAGPAGAEPPMR